MITVSVTDASAIDAFNRLIAFGENPRGALLAINEKMLEFTKERFEQSVDPYGTPWQQNADTTLRNVLHGSGKNFTKKGALSKRGQTVLAGKKPLIGESRSLSNLLHPLVIGDNLATVSSSMVYAAMQQFGGTKAEFPHLWGDIPARPFFPDASRGLPEALQQDITNVLRIAIQNAMGGT